MTPSSPRIPPKRQSSTVSSASSGRTVRASSGSGSAGTASNRSGIFARLTGSGPRRRSVGANEDNDEDEEDDEGEDDEDSGDGEDGDGDGRNGQRGQRTPRAFEPMEMGDDDGNGIDQAGPSDYWRRTPSPSPLTSPSVGPKTEAWRKEASREPWPLDLEESHADIWVNHDSRDAWAEHGRSHQEPAFGKDGSGNRHEKGRGVGEGQGQELEEGSVVDSGAGTADDDDREYARRMRDVFSGSGPRAELGISQGKEDTDAFDSLHSDGSSAKFTGGYDATYRSVVGVKGGIGEDEFGAYDFALRDDTSSAPSSSSLLSIRDKAARPTPTKRTVTPYLHPSVSRLRSHVRSTSETTQGSSSFPRGLHTRTPSHFSQVSLSRSDSTSTLALPHAATSEHAQNSTPAFSFHPLRHLSAHLFGRRSGRSSPSRPPSSRRISALGAAQDIITGEDTSALGHPSVIDVRGMIAVGTDGGFVVVYGFGQEVNHVLGTDAIAANSGPVTAVTISSDQTYIAVGHATGNIHLYDLSTPTKPARTTAALTLKQALSGRKEGHLKGSRILHIGFVGSRHTSIVSGDEHGRAFWWSLGRVMGVESTDVVRMLGSYPEPDSEVEASTTEGERPLGYPSRKPSTLFEAQTLPLGETTHSTDSFHFSILLTPIKLVVVGMKPSAQTWYRKMRGDIGGEDGGVVGCAAWLRAGEIGEGSDPVLVYSWGSHLRFLKVGTKVESPVDRGKSEANEVPEFIEGRRYEAPNPVLALQWYDPNHVLIVTKAEIVLLNVRTLRAVETTTLQTRLLTSNNFYSGLAKSTFSVPIPPAIASSVRVHRAKLFLLTQSNVQVGSLQHWNDRILSRVHAGDFLGSIHVALAYYESSSAPGNTINLPEDPTERKDVVGARVRELMRASLEWAFSDDRMHDDTHYSADGRGVDLTGLFEGLAASCIEACLSMNDMSFLFEEAYEAYANTGIQRLFLQVLEPYIFDGRIRNVPPTIVQGLITMHDEKGELDLAEAVIWHVEPIALDINQAVTLCEKHHLWDALIHVYTRAMRDYVAPIVKLVRLVHEIQNRRDARPSFGEGYDFAEEDHQEAFVPEAYKLFAYLEQILSGTCYPSGEGLPREEADRARADVYAFLFSDRLAFWPDGRDGRPVLPLQANTPYPYLDLLLRFDTEAFLHSMDIAFEDSYLNDSRAPFSRQTIINIMLDIMSREDDDGQYRVHNAGDVTLLHIFVARNLPKYPQFLFIAPSTLHSILVSLAADPDMSTREDRQLAAEYLLSAYTPHDMNDMLVRFESAGFFRILRGAYHRDGKWAPLIEAYVNDPDIGNEVFASIGEIVKKTCKASKRTGKHLPEEVVRAIERALPSLFDVSIRQAALLIDSDVPLLHSAALQALASNEHKQMAYLRCLLEPGLDDGDHDKVSTWPTVTSTTPLTNLDTAARHLYVDLVAKHDSSALVPFLDARGPKFFDLSKLSDQLSSNGIYDGQLWALDRAGDTPRAMETATDVVRAQGADLAQAIVGDEGEGAAHVPLETILSTVKMAVRLCGEHSARGDTKAEDMWYSVLSEVVELNQTVGALADGSSTTKGPSSSAVAVSEALRGLVQDTLQSLVSSSSSSRLSFPRLFKRLVDDASDESLNGKAKARKGRAYAEFRSILSGMLDSYRTESDMLLMTTRLVQDDLFGDVKKMKEQRVRGWRPVVTHCEVCNGTLFVVEASKAKSKGAGKETGKGTRKGKGKGPGIGGGEEQVAKTTESVVVLGSGGARHAACPPVAVQVGG